MEPRVETKFKEWSGIQAGVVVGSDQVYYALRQPWKNFYLSSYDTIPNYAFLLWEANIPEYMQEKDFTLSPNISKVRLLPERNAALLFMSLEKGDNEIIFRCDKPAKYIRIEDQRYTGRRFEIYIRNDGPPVELVQLNVKMKPNLQIGGFWWDGKYHDSIYYYEYSPYDWRTGNLTINATYPMSLPLHSGLTRCSIEIMGEMANPSP
jgi:hypothetical protein